LEKRPHKKLRENKQNETEEKKGRAQKIEDKITCYTEKGQKEIKIREHI
jgi:hypothetical protein